MAVPRLPRHRRRGVLFGANKEGKAAEVPITVAKALEEIVWLPPLAEIGGIQIVDGA